MAIMITLVWVTHLSSQLLTGMGPYAKYKGPGSPHVAQIRLITAVVDNNQLPERPAPESDAYTRFGMTDNIWGRISDCWAVDPALRPTASGLLQHLTTIA